jgi:hypothetical protein
MPCEPVVVACHFGSVLDQFITTVIGARVRGWVTVVAEADHANVYSENELGRMYDVSPVLRGWRLPSSGRGGRTTARVWDFKCDIFDDARTCVYHIIVE